MKVLLKKYFPLILSTILFCTNIFAQNSQNVKVWVMPTEGKNLSNSESRWLPDEVHKALRANITNYSGLIVAEENANVLAQIQEKSYNENISDTDMVRMGKLIGANYVIRSTITAAGGAYSLNVVFQNLESGAHFAESNQNAKTTETLYMNPGCAVNEATIELCDRLDSKFGTGLSSYNKRILRNGTNDLSSDEETKYLADEEKRLNQLISNLNKEINSASLSTEADAAMLKTQLELQKAQQEEKLRQTQKRQERLLEEEKNRLAEQKEQASRSTAQKNRISSVEQTLNKKVEELRKQNFDTSSVLAQIGVIEAKKKAVIEIRASRDEDTKKLVREGEAEILAKKAEIMNAPLREAQTNSDGTMREAVRKSREELAAKEEQKIQGEYTASIEKMQKLSKEAENDLLAQIKDHNKDLNKDHSINNIVTRDFKLEVNRFIGERDAWNATVIFVSEGQELYSTNFDITYKELTKKNPDVLSDEYLDDVDLYNSLFSRNVNPITAQMRYSMRAAPDDKPSQYILHVYNIVLTHTDTGEKIKELSVNNDFTKQMTPPYDVRDERTIKVEKVRTEKEIVKQENKQKVINVFADYTKEFDQETGRFGSFNGFGSAFAFTPGGSLCDDHWMYMSLPWNHYVFFGLEFGSLPVFDKMKPYTLDSQANYVAFGLGGNKRILSLLGTNVFARAEIGGYSVKPVKTQGPEYIEGGKIVNAKVELTEDY